MIDRVLSWRQILWEIGVLSYRMGYRFLMKSHHMETSKPERLIQESYVVGDIEIIHTTATSQQNCFLSQQSWFEWARNLSFKIKMLILHHIVLLN